jgi:hypothetical protein
MGGTRVDREGWRGVVWKRNRGLRGNSKGEVRNVREDVNQTAISLTLSFWVLMAETRLGFRFLGNENTEIFVLRERERERMAMEMN